MLKVLTIVEGIGTVTVLILTLREFWKINKILKQQKRILTRIELNLLPMVIQKFRKKIRIQELGFAR